jgi:hypothetical protein
VDPNDAKSAVENSVDRKLKEKDAVVPSYMRETKSKLLKKETISRESQYLRPGLEQKSVSSNKGFSPRGISSARK